MDTRAVAREFAGRIIGHRNALSGKADDALRVQFALHQAGSALDDQQDAVRKAAGNALGHWEGANSEQFERRSDRLARQVRMTASVSAQAEKVVAGASSALVTGHAAAQRLVDEYVTKAVAVLDAGVASGSQAALMKAVAAAADLEPRYTRESVRNVRQVKAELDEAQRQLKALEKEIEADGIAGPRAARRGGGVTKPSGAKAREIVSAARGEIGTRESPPGSNRNPYGPTTFWCSSFATAMWRKAGVDIPVLPFTGDVYRWGQRHGKAYGNGNLKDNVRPGDVLLFGTGPQSPATSKHIGIVEKVDGDTVTLIEGNSGDQVRRNTHQLSGTKFYGGVHP
ncbi:CHAP domain-containing protein [Lentzea jiangxiensis]|uniref:Cell wall-associated hydrolase, NlpC family n=1 Tax=Lentzea jiangxiensis TaxID=641025 RepID=A0A1H0RPX0_9PSEU|nr:CHAP domain-containing protein [Lentzea jiangxiensis]SDP31562.1 Cell wall-associated hydrolase, NlpC family [Lentzea jiangxiensis]